MDISSVEPTAAMSNAVAVSYSSYKPVFELCVPRVPVLQRAMNQVLEVRGSTGSPGVRMTS